MSKSKIFKRTISIAMVIMLLIQTMTFSISATNEDSPTEPTECVTVSSTEEAKGIKKEIISKRGEYEKHFLCNDGSYIAATYPEQVNYKDDNGNWIEIDNTLTKSNGRIKNKNQELKVSFSDNATDVEMIELSYNNIDFSWSLLFNNKGKNIFEKSSGIDITDNVSLTDDLSVENYLEIDYNEVAEKPNTSKAVIDVNTDVKSFDTENLILAADKVESKLTYKSVYSDNVDASYTVLPNRVKENIILTEKTDLQNYSMNIKCEDLIPTITDDNCVEFKDVNGKIQYIIQAPYMFDDIYELSYDIQITIETVDGGYIITFTPNQEWLSSDDRVYPITIDPTVRTNTTKANFSDTYVYEGSSASSTRCFEERLRIGVYSVSSSYKAHRAFWKVATLPTIDSPVTITGASFRLTFPSATTTSRAFSLYKANSSWTSETITWSNMPSCTLLASNVARNTSSNTVTFSGTNVTDTVRGWYNTGVNNGFMIRYTDETKTNPDFNVAYSSDNTTSTGYMPYLTITYVDGYTPISSGLYYIKSSYSNKYLTLNSSNNVVQKTFSGEVNQCWKLSSSGGFYKIEPVYNPNYVCMDIDNAWDGDGTNVKCFAKSDNNSAQNFRIIASTSSTFRISPECSDTRVLDVCGPSTDDGANIQLWQYENVSQQNWIFYDASQQIFNKINSLHTYAKQYDSNYKNNNELVCQYIRQNDYNDLLWYITADGINKNFVFSVDNNTDLGNLQYLADDEQKIWGNCSYETIDLSHMFATINAHLYNADRFGNADLPEEIVKDLSGWAGDLQQMIADIIITKSRIDDPNLTDYSYFYMYCYTELISDEYVSTFSMSDLLGDLDAIYIADTVTSTSNLGTQLTNYYSGACSNRFSRFIDGRTKNEMYEDMYYYTKNVWNSSIWWPLYASKGVIVFEDQARAAAHAFVDYIWTYY